MVDPPAPVPAPAAVDGDSHGAVVGQEIKAGFAYLQLKYYNAVSEQEEFLPKGTKLNIFYIDDRYGKRDKRYKTKHSGNQIEIAGDDGKISFKLEQEKKVTFEIRFTDKTPSYVQVKRGGNVAKLLTQTALNEAIKADKEFYTKEMVFMLPNGLSPDRSKWKIENCANYDAATKLFDVSATKQIKADAGGHLPVILQPEWQFLSFRYNDPHDDTDRAVPQGLVVFGYNLRASAKRPVTRSNMYLAAKGCLLIPWMRNVDMAATRQAVKVALRFKAPKLFVNNDGGIKLVEKKPEDVQKLELVKRLKFFDLPPKWSATGWRVKYDGAWSLITYTINKATTKDKPIMFYLDSVVLTDQKLKRYPSSKMPWGAVHRITVFDIKMKIFNPEADKPYWTLGTINSNFINPEVTGKKPRVIARHGVFFDITSKRVAKGTVLGARAAVRNDKAVHHGEKAVKPMMSLCGNYEIHYFADCLDTANAECAYTLIYWSCIFKKGGGYASNATYVSDRGNFRKIGLKGAKDRWERKAYRFKRRTNKGKDIVVYPQWFFEGRERNPKKCELTITRTPNTTSWMRLTDSLAAHTTYQPTGHTMAEDGINWDWFTLSHELGHATGSTDEYLKRISGSNYYKLLPTFNQVYKRGVQYAFDELSIMKANRAPRLRHIWYLCRRLNRSSSVQKLTQAPDAADGNKMKPAEFQIVSSDGAEKYKFFLKEKDSSNKTIWNYYNAAHSKNGQTNGVAGKFDLKLFKVGHDETDDYMVTGQSGFDSILFIRPKLEWRLQNHDAVNWASAAAKITHLENFQEKMNQKFNNRFWLECTDAAEKDYKKVYLYFVPYYRIGAGSGEHFQIKVKRNNTAAIKTKPSYYTAGFHSRTFTVDEKQDFVSIMRYLLGLKPFQENNVQKVVGGVPQVDAKGLPVMEKVKVDTTTITKDDLGFLADWVKSKRGNRVYTAKQRP